MKKRLGREVLVVVWELEGQIEEQEEGVRVYGMGVLAAPVEVQVAAVVLVMALEPEQQQFVEGVVGEQEEGEGGD